MGENPRRKRTERLRRRLAREGLLVTPPRPGAGVPVGVRELLSASLTERGLRQWLYVPNRALDRRRPVDVLASGDEAAVLSAARAFAEGMNL